MSCEIAMGPRINKFQIFNCLINSKEKFKFQILMSIEINNLIIISDSGYVVTLCNATSLCARIVDLLQAAASHHLNGILSTRDHLG